MGLFDLFSNKTAENAALKANQGLREGYGAYADLAGQGRNALTTGYGAGRTAVTSGYGAGRDAVTSGYGAGRGALTDAYGKADDIWSNTMKSYDDLYKGGADAYGDVSGAHGVEGLQRGTNLFRNSGQYGVYGAANDAAQQALQRSHAAGGNALSGNADVDAMKKASELAGNYWGQFQQGLRPYLDNYGSAIGTVAAGRANAATGLGNALNANYTGEGNTLNTNYTGEGTALGNLYTGEGNALNTSYGNEGTAANNLYSTIGRNDAGAELNKYQVARNQFDAIKSAASLAASVGTGGLSGGLSGLFSGFGGGGASAANSGAAGGGYYGPTGQVYAGPGYYPNTATA